MSSIPSKLKLNVTFYPCTPLPNHRRWFIGRNVFGKNDTMLGGKNVCFYRDTKDHAMYVEVDGQWYVALLAGETKLVYDE